MSKTSSRPADSTETISSVEAPQVFNGPSQDVGSVGAGHNEVAVVAEQSPNDSGIVAVIDAEDIRPVLRLVDLFGETTTDGAPPTLLFQKPEILLNSDPIALPKTNSPCRLCVVGWGAKPC